MIVKNAIWGMDYDMHTGECYKCPCCPECEEPVWKGKHAKYKSEVTPETVFALKSQGLSFNKISKILNLDWGCVKQRYEDYVHDKNELLEE